MTGVTSDAAIATITIPPPLLQSDPLLNLILTISPSHQVKIISKKKTNTLSLTSSVVASNKSDVELKQRNAILRSICGMTFHNALDKYPFYVLGGHSASGKASMESAICLASVSSYMSIASSIRDDTSNDDSIDLSQIYSQLNSVLANNSFLVGSTPKPTLADLDVFFALSTASKGTIKLDDSLIHCKRWLLATLTAVEEMIATGTATGTGTGVDISLPLLDFKIGNDPCPLFYFGDEDGIDDIQSTSVPSGASGASSGASKETPNANDKNDKKGKDNNNSGKKELTDEQKKAAAEKRAKKNAKKKEKKPSTTTPPPYTTELNASAFDIRVGKIVQVWEHEESDKLWCEKVDLGEEGGPRQILSGLRKFYNKEDMQDKLVLVLCNLKKRNLVGVSSHGMVLCACNADHTEVEFVIPPPDAKIGERVMFGNIEGEPETENKFAKKKMLEKLVPDLKTDQDGVVIWKEAKSVTSAGPCVASKGMKGAQVS